MQLPIDILAKFKVNLKKYIIWVIVFPVKTKKKTFSKRAVSLMCIEPLLFVVVELAITTITNVRNIRFRRSRTRSI